MESPGSANLEDNTLAARAAMGDRQAFQTLIERYRRYIYAIAYKISLDEEEALDITQNVYLRLVEKIGDFEGRGSFRAWLATLTVRQTLSRRRQSGHREIPGDSVKKGDTIATLENDDLRYNHEKAVMNYQASKDQLDIEEKNLTQIQQQYEAGRIALSEMNKAEMGYQQGTSRLRLAELEFQRAERQLSYCTLAAPADGTLHPVNVHQNQPVKAGQTVAVLIPEDAEADAEEMQESDLPQYHPTMSEIQYGDKTYTFRKIESAAVGSGLTILYVDKASEPRTRSIQIPGQDEYDYSVVHIQSGRTRGESDEVLETITIQYKYIPKGTISGSLARTQGEGLKSPEAYGISPEDMQMFGLAAVKEMGRGITQIVAERGEGDIASVALTEDYRCEFEFQDIREPYLIVRGRLVDADSGQPLLENTLYLDAGSPAILGLTNLRQALILIVKASE